MLRASLWEVSRVIKAESQSQAQGPFARHLQKRWKKPVISARQHLESRTRDLPLERLMDLIYKKLWLIQRIQHKILKRRDQELPLDLLGRRKHMLRLNKPPGAFLKKYPHIFQVFTHPVKKAPFCKLTQKTLNLIGQEKATIRENEAAVVQTLQKLLMMSTSRRLELHLLNLVENQFGFPNDLKESVILKYPQHFRIVQDGKFVELVSWDQSLAVAKIQEWRSKEHLEKWLKKSEVQFAFRIQFPSGFRIEKGFKEKMKNWQMVPYLSPYEDVGECRRGGRLSSEKRAVAVIHELLSLTVEKMMEVERISHFRKPYSMELNVRDLILEHPGIFYISSKGRILTVFLREAYFRGRLIEPNPVYSVRRRFMDLIELTVRNAKALSCGEVEKSVDEQEFCEIQDPKDSEEDVGIW